MKNRILLFPALILCWTFGHGQKKLNITWGKVESKDFSIPALSVIDSNTNAIILADIGSTYFTGFGYKSPTYLFTRKARIKIINKKGFDAAEVKIPLPGFKSLQSSLYEISGETYNLVNGLVISTKLDKNDVFTELVDEENAIKKFTMPAINEGSIIEFSYTVRSSRFFDIPTWKFQSPAFPCLWSEYEVEIPKFLSFVSVKQGIHDFYSNDISDDGRDGISQRWVMKEIPALNINGEKYISTPTNYIDQVEFQLSNVSTRSIIYNSSNSWPRITEELMKSDHFGKQISDGNGWLDNDLKQICGQVKDPKEQARKIYYFVSSHINCKSSYGWMVSKRLKDVYQSKSGNVGEINLLLIAMLREEGLNADPVLLSTRGFGHNSPSYPIISKLNYLICRVIIDNNEFYLDASDPCLGFGELPQDCYNGHARIINEQSPASIFFFPDSLKEFSSTNVVIINDEKGRPGGGLQTTAGIHESQEIRRRIRKDGQENFFKSIQTQFGSDYALGNMGFESLDSLEDPISYHYDFDLPAWNGQDFIYFNPMVQTLFKENPFKSPNRKFPVEMPYALDDVYVFSMEIPSGYVVDEIPKSAKVELNGIDGIFEYVIEKTDKEIQLRCHTILNKATFEPSEYAPLREFYASISKKEHEQIVFKRKN